MAKKELILFVPAKAEAQRWVQSSVMPALVAGVHACLYDLNTWMAGTSPAMTRKWIAGTSPAMTFRISG